MPDAAKMVRLLAALVLIAKGTSRPAVNPGNATCRNMGTPAAQVTHDKPSDGDAGNCRPSIRIR